MLDNLPFASLVHDPEGHVVWANAPAERLLSQPGRDAIELPWQAAQTLGLVERDGQARSDVIEHVTGGSTRWLKVDVVAVGTAGEVSGFLTTLTDVSESERVRRRSIALMSLAQNLARNVTNYQAALHTLARETADLVGDGVLVTMLSPDGRWLQRAAHYHRDPVRRAAGRNLLGDPYPATEGPVASVVKSGRPLRVDSFEVSPALDRKYAQFVRAFGIRCFVMVPLVADGRILGTLGVSREAPPYEDEDVSFLESVADTAALAILNARLHAEASMRLSRLESLHQSEMAAAASLDMPLRLQLLLDQVRSALHLQRAAIYGAEPLREERTMIAAVGEPSSSSATSHLADDPERRLSVALGSRGYRYGSLELFSAAPFQLDSESWQFLETLAARAASVLENGRLVAEAATPMATGDPSGFGGKLARLTSQQQLIVQLAGQGKSNREIAQEIHLSANTVKFHLRHIFRKLGLRNRLDLVRFAYGTPGKSA